MIDRIFYRSRLETALERSPVVALLGPRQCGKTTLARVVLEAREHGGGDYYDIESPRDQARLQNPEMVLGSAHGLVVLDEIQEKPQLFAVLRSLVDRPSCRAKFLVLGSASPELVRGASESLAGRVEFVDLTAFRIAEVGFDQASRLWLRGGFPRSFLARSEEDSLAWREGFIRTFLERDLPQLGITIPAPAMRRLWTMLAHYHGQTWNASAIARSMGVSDKTARSYLDILTQTYMVRQLQPFYANTGKRQVKAPKVYLRDTGLLHALLSLENPHAVMGHPKVGASWEGFALEQVLSLLQPREAWFWTTYSGGEVDLIFDKGGKRYGIEFKFSEAPKVPATTRRHVEALGLEHLWIVCPCPRPFEVHDSVSVTNIEHVAAMER